MKKHFSLFKLLLLSIFVGFVGCKEEKSIAEVEEPVQQKDFKIIAYYTPSTGKIDEETVDQLDQIIFSFLHLKENELSYDSVEDSTSLAYLTSLKQQNPNLEVLVSLGGWGGCETCSEVFSSTKGREEFAGSTKRILEDFNADGIDLDWEYPAVENFPGHPFKPEDKQNFTALVAELRETLGEDYEISFAAPGFDRFILNSVEWDKVMPLVDNLNLMSYDMVSGGSTMTGHHTGLFSIPSQRLSADYSLKFLDSIGVPKEKIVIGAAFYARVWQDVPSINNGLSQPGKFKQSVLYKDLDAFQEQNPGFKKYYDTIAQAPYLYNEEKGLFATFDDSVSIEMKTEYALRNGLGGIMFWQLSGDKSEDGLLDIIYSVKNR